MPITTSVYHNGITFIDYVKSSEQVSDRLAVSFAPHGGMDVAQPGYAQAMLLERGWDVLAVKSVRSNWYQDVSWEDVSALLDSLPAYGRVITVGSNMGAYGGLYFASAVRAEDVIALSPQVSADPGQVPWDERWIADTADLVFEHRPLADVITGQPLRVHAIFDPASPDDRHVALLADMVPLDALPLPHAGSPVDFVLEETDLFETLIDRAIEGELRLPREQWQRRRRASASFHHFLAIACRGSGHGRTAEALLAQAVALERRPNLLLEWSDALLENSRMEAALVARREGTQALPPNPHLLARLGFFEEMTGDLHEAARHYADAIALAPEEPAFYKSELRVLRTLLENTPDEISVPSTMAGNREGLAELDRLRGERQQGALSGRNLLLGALLPFGIVAIFVILGRVFGWL
jgi:hypothetical protein